MNDVSLPPVELGATLTLSQQCRNGSNVSSAPDGAPSVSIYPNGSNTAVATGSLSAADIDSKTGYRTGDFTISAGNGYASGVIYRALITWEVSSTAFAAEKYFRVV